MFDRKYVESLAAQSLYEELSEKEQAVLNDGFKKYPDLAEFHAEMEGILKALPDDTPEFKGDLLVDVRAGLTKKADPPVQHLRIYALAAVACLAVGFFAFSLMPQSKLMESDTMAVESSPVADAILASKETRENGDATEAYANLKESLAANMDDPYAAEAQLLLADLAYEELSRFEDAHADYAAYRSEYQTAFNLSARRNEILRRAELLEETAKEDYRPLELLAQARLRGTDALPELESLLTEYAAMFVGDEAAYTMASVVQEEGVLQGEAMRDALAMARERCTQPIAQDQIDLVLGKYTADVLDDAEGSAVYFERAVASDDARVAQAARDQLEQFR